ncbi:BlaR1 peptidase M56 [Mariniflexile rhizosphaerae]|uniref:M56 family metallopeptidase n=1 Tax=unclassified Mariniflexile TaxID=2643887 RepID=UPI000CA90E35|nr:M56 family metallopeptidase [Mariniflexile sp. TRM1-10]AXP81834.1 BlaR1 peptidase M56 [Mariniflexile sp. TRM1-10]PLB20782.1 MAG: Regulatory sensor-transducer, BlaR1/MecR1 family [Flavobacteriaceae bacterium FS1-H7996/R]
MEYLIKASAIIALFYIIYKILLQRETFFELNRWFLLIGLVAAFLLPFIVIPIYVEAPPLDFSGYIFKTSITTENVEKPFNLLEYLPLIYGLGVVCFSIRFIVQFTSLALVFIKNKGEKIDGYRFIKTTNNVSPFSFFNWIVYNPIPFSKTELEQIITHEKVHAKQSHSFDILITHISCVLLWFNPFIWLYNKDLKQNLEFIADAVTATKTDCKKSYQYTLLKTSMPSHQMALSNPFYNSLIKKRIVMLHKSKSKKINQLKYALVIPALALFLMSFNTEEVYIQEVNNRALNPDNSKDIKIIFNKDLTDNDLEKTKSELKKDSIDFAYTNLKRNEKEEIVSITTKFQNERGSSATWNAYNTKNEPIKPFYFFKTEKTIGVSILDKETSEIEDSKETNKTSPWKVSVRNNISSDSISVVEYTNDSIHFNKKKEAVKTYREEAKDEVIIITNNTHTNYNTNQEQQPLFIVDGKEISKEDMNVLDPNHIKKIDVLKGENATRLFGDKGKEGVILITTKKDKREDHLIVKKPFDSISKRKNSSKHTTKHTIKLSGEALYIIDGKEEKEEVFEKIHPDKIASVNVLKGDHAIKKYGEKGKHGVIEITTKKK